MFVYAWTVEPLLRVQRVAAPVLRTLRVPAPRCHCECQRQSSSTMMDIAMPRILHDIGIAAAVTAA